MSIILRTNKGQALTYDEMDRNQSQFFYSSSLHNNSTKLRLHYTGSDNLDTATEDYGPARYQEIPFPTFDIEQIAAAAAGSNTQVQFNDNGVFGADSLFTFNKANNYLGVGTGTPLDRVDVHGDGTKGATISLRGQSGGTGTLRHATTNFLEGSTYLGRIGRASSTTDDLYFVNNKEVGSEFGKVHIGAGTGDATTDNADSIVAATFTRTSTGVSKVGIGTKIPNRQISLVGTAGIGISATGDNNLQSFLSPLPSGIFNSTNGGGQKDLIPNNSEPVGLLISSPIQTNGGNIVMAINTDTINENEGFNIIKSFAGNYNNSEVIFSAQANGKVGVNTNFPSDIGLTVAGNISGSGTLQVETIATGTANNTSALVATSTGLVQKIAAAPVPVGGIIMWSGAIGSIPDGWSLCDGSGTTPDLTDKFVVGAGSAYAVDAEGGSKDAVAVSHTHNATVVDPGHTHTYRGNNIVVGDSSEGNNHLDYNNNLADTGNSQTGISVNISTSGVSGTNKNLPPYYALAFIMYVGS